MKLKSDKAFGIRYRLQRLADKSESALIALLILVQLVMLLVWARHLAPFGS